MSAFPFSSKPKRKRKRKNLLGGVSQLIKFPNKRSCWGRRFNIKQVFFNADFVLHSDIELFFKFELQGFFGNCDF